MKNKVLIFLTIVLSTISCKKDDCIDESKITNNACILIYDPVCGCDGKTYGNECAASNSGVISWTEGECN